MTGRTHDLGALTALNSAFVLYHPHNPVDLTAIMFVFFANMLGGLIPDLDNQSSSFYKKIRGGRLLGKIITPLIGGHRMISHSLIGLFIFSKLSHYFLSIISQTVLIDMQLVWFAFIIGIISHFLLDSFTKEGIPLFFPIPIRVGFPPLSALRIKTGGLLEKGIIFPGLIAINFFLVFQYKDVYLIFIDKLIH